MTEFQFKCSISVSAVLFALVFVFYTVPAAIDTGIIEAFAAGFVNPFAASFAIDVILCWCILTFWILYERKVLKIRHGWLCIALSTMPGLAVGFPAYLWLRHHQLSKSTTKV